MQNETDLEYKRRVIDIKSDSFCAAKWYNATIWLGSGMTTSCHHPPAHKVDVQEVKFNPKALHNSLQKKDDRKKMLAGERPVGCEYCWKIEDMGRDAISDRVYKTKIYTDEQLEAAFNTPFDKDINLRTLEIAFDRTCQFACSYCNPAFSSTWVKDIKQNGEYTNLISDGRNHFTHTHDSAQLFKFGDTNPYVEAFYQWWESDLHKTWQELRITGGEPLMSGEMWRLLDWFKNNKGKSNTRLSINSNLGPEVDLDRLIDSVDGIEQVDVYTSNESMGVQAEYIRDGLNFEVWKENILKITKSGKFFRFHVMCTINALCLDSLPDFLDFMVGMKKEHGRDFPNFTLNILRFPSFQSPLVLPDDIRTAYKDRLVDWVNKHKDADYLHQHEINHVLRLIDYLDVVKTPHSDTFDMPKLHNDFKQFYQQYDVRRKKSLITAFPALKTWYESL